MGAVLLSPLYLLLNFYLASRILLWLHTLHSFLGSIWFTAPFSVLYICMALTPLFAAFGKGRFKKYSRSISNYWMGILMYLLILLLLLDLARILLCLAQHKSLATPFSVDSYRISGGILFALVTLVSVHGILHAAYIKKTHYNVTIHKTLPDSLREAAAGAHRDSAPEAQDTARRDSASEAHDTAHRDSAPEAHDAAHRNVPLRIALAADLHLGGNVGLPQVRQIARIIRKMQPDLIVFAGDIFDNDFDAVSQPEKIAALLREMPSTYGSFACWGNHDIDERILAGFTFDSGRGAVSSDPRMDQFLEDAGILLLKDQTLLIDNSFYLTGRLDASCQKKSGICRLTPQLLLDPLDHEKPLLVIDHQPSELDELAQAGADLVLSGHTHDGQLFPGNLTTRIGWKNSCGKLVIGAMTSIVTSGAGVWGPAMRVGTDSEVVEIDVQFSEC